MRVEAGSWVRHAPSAAHKYVAQVVRKPLQIISSEIRVIPQKVVVGWTARSLINIKHQVREIKSKPSAKLRNVGFRKLFKDILESSLT